MGDLAVQSAGEVTSGLSQWQRVANIFTAPSKTFEDIKRGNKSWWMPFLIMALVGYILFAAVTLKIGMQQVADNQIKFDPKQSERMAQASPEQREMGAKISLYITEVIFIANPLFVLGVLPCSRSACGAPSTSSLAARLLLAAYFLCGCSRACRRL